NVTTSEIDGLPSANRSQFAVMQTIPGMVPTLQPGSFEGGQFSANGQATTNNLFVNGNHSLSFRWTRERILTVNDSIENDLAIPDAARHENDSGDQVFSFSWTSVLNNRTTNEVKVGHVRENLLQGPKALFDKTASESAFFDHSWYFIGLHGREPFDVGSQNTHPDYIAGPRNTYAQNIIRDITFDDSLNWLESGWAGDH